MQRFPKPLKQCEWVEVRTSKPLRRGWGRDFEEACSTGGLDPDDASIEGRDATILDAPKPGSEAEKESRAAATGITEYWLSSKVAKDLGDSCPPPKVVARLRALMKARLYARALLYTADAIFDAYDESVGPQVCPGCGESTLDAEAKKASCSECGWVE